MLNKSHRATGFANGFKLGMKSLAYSLKSGFTGLVEQPIKGHKEGGMGVLKGSIAGLTGLLIKPITGLIDATSKTIEGINHSASYVDHQEI